VDYLSWDTRVVTGSLAAINTEGYPPSLKLVPYLAAPGHAMTLRLVATGGKGIPLSFD